MLKKRHFKKLRLYGKAIAFVDWANVHGWRGSLKREVDAHLLLEYLRSYPQVEQVRFYYGLDKHWKSALFLEEMAGIGYLVRTKTVKHIRVLGGGSRRKCDFDMEICMDVHVALQDGFETHIFLTGDGDFAPLYAMLIERKKKVIVIYCPGHLGREVWALKRGVFKVELENLGNFLK